MAINWRKTAFGVFLFAMLLSLQLIAAPQAMAMTANSSSVTFHRAVVAWYDEKGQLQLNVATVLACAACLGVSAGMCMLQCALGF
ncbi:hypothetical protein [Thermococcus stetteri]|uniref:hypothetical protein n=1 Tax=Thermococcus stetteri TaxID=49900 RepID=UPI001AE18968|nr:hypothetical protein [Thermococcus stetteri]